MNLTKTELKKMIMEEIEAEHQAPSIKEFESREGIPPLNEASELFAMLDPDTAEALTIIVKAMWKMGKEVGIPGAELSSMVAAGLEAVKKIRGTDPPSSAEPTIDFSKRS